MTNPPQSASQLLSNDNSQLLRRPGWGLVMMFARCPNITQSRWYTAGIQPESRPQPATLAVLHNLTPAQTKKST